MGERRERLSWGGGGRGGNCAAVRGQVKKKRLLLSRAVLQEGRSVYTNTLRRQICREKLFARQARNRK